MTTQAPFTLDPRLSERSKTTLMFLLANATSLLQAVTARGICRRTSIPEEETNLVSVALAAWCRKGHYHLKRTRGQTATWAYYIDMSQTNKAPTAVASIKNVKTQPAPDPIAEPPKPVAQLVQLDQTLDELVGDLGEQIGTLLLNSITDTISDTLPLIIKGLTAQAAHATQTKGGDKPARLPKAIVFGLLPRQQREIRKTFAGMLDLRFMKVAGPAKQITKTCQTADVIIAAADFISHAQQDKIKAANTHYVPVKGGLLAIENALEDFCLARMHKESERGVSH